ncbi:Uncharacterised protein [Leuconostoc mesenteroides]|jgi:hypothetical protein|nr:Uncharacterised protein [Leuconostoc mesenteroides]
MKLLVLKFICLINLRTLLEFYFAETEQISRPRSCATYCSEIGIYKLIVQLVSVSTFYMSLLRFV